MAGKMSNYLEGGLLARLLGLSSPTPITLPVSGTLYLGVCTANPEVSDGASYTEVSPSGTGVKAFVEAASPGPATRRNKVELYGHGRYFTVTGARLAGFSLFA